MAEGGPAGFGEGQGTRPGKMRGHREEIKKKNIPTTCSNTVWSSDRLRPGKTVKEPWSRSQREDSLQLETEINSSSLSVWPQHLVGAEEDRRLRSAAAAAWKAAGPQAQLGLTQKRGAPLYFLWPLDLWG